MKKLYITAAVVVILTCVGVTALAVQAQQYRGNGGLGDSAYRMAVALERIADHLDKEKK